MATLLLSMVTSLCCHDYTHRHGSLMALLYWQLGWEVGVVKRLLATNQINWGYFFDHNPFEPHCNAHPNNFVVLPPVSRGGWEGGREGSEGGRREGK